MGNFSSLVENTGKKFAIALQFVGIFVGIGKLNDRGEFRYSDEGIEQMASKNDGAGAKRIYFAAPLQRCDWPPEINAAST